MDQAKNAAHIGYDTWKPSGSYPKAQQVTGEANAGMNVVVQGILKAYTSGNVDMEEFTSINKETNYIKLMNTGNTSYNYTITSDAKWINVDKTSGVVEEEDTVHVSVNFKKIKDSATGKLTISGNGQTVTVSIKASRIDVASLDENTYVEAHNYITVEAGNYSQNVSGENNVSWKEIQGYGRSKSGMKVFPTTKTFEDVTKAPYMEYKFYVDNSEDYLFRTDIAPSNNVDWNRVTMKFGYQIDNGEINLADTIPSSYIAGTWRDSTWSNAVRNNIRSVRKTMGKLEKGVHTLRIYAVDPAIVVEKYIIYPSSSKLKTSYLGPEESFFKTKDYVEDLYSEDNDSEDSTLGGNNSNIGTVNNLPQNTSQIIQKKTYKKQKITVKKVFKLKTKTCKKKNKKIKLKAKTNGRGKLSYKVISYPKKMKKYISVSKTGVVTLKKGIKKGSYKIQITASQTSKYKKASTSVKIRLV